MLLSPAAALVTLIVEPFSVSVVAPVKWSAESVTESRAELDAGGWIEVA